MSEMTESGLTKQELAICRNCCIDPEDYKSANGIEVYAGVASNAGNDPADEQLTKNEVAVAACMVDLAGDVPNELRLVPAGRFRARDGRPVGIAGWNIDARLAAQVIARAKARADDFVIDYEHQTLYTRENGKPAPAAGWCRAGGMEWREDGLYATGIEWTASAQARLKAREYRYLSPVIAYHPKSGDVLAVTMAALTNHAAIDGLDDLAARAAATFSAGPDPEANGAQLTENELAICRSMGIDPEEYKKANAEEVH